MTKLTNLEYLGVLLLCFAFPFVFSLIHRRVLKKEGYSIINTSTLVAAIPFLIWDIWAVNTGRWWFNKEVITGIKLFNLPIEEVFFFILIPQSCLLLWVGIKKYNSWKRLKKDLKKHWWVKKFI